jgi:hypothetical protein
MVRVVLWTLFACSEWAQPVSEEASTTCEGVARAPFRFVGVDTDSHFSGVHNR